MNALKRQLASIKENCSKLDAEIEQAKASIAALRKGSANLHRGTCANLSPERKKEASILEKHDSQQKPELKALESALHMTVEGVRRTCFS